MSGWWRKNKTRKTNAADASFIR